MSFEKFGKKKSYSNYEIGVVNRPNFPIQFQLLKSRFDYKSIFDY